MINILLVEDEMLFAKSVLRRLEKEGYNGNIVSTIADAHHSINTALPDLLLLDIRLPDGNGLDLLADIRFRDDASWKSLPVIVMTAYGELDDAISAMKLGATDYLKKPVDLDDLVLTISKVLATQQLKQQLTYSHVRDRQSVDAIEMIGTSQAADNVRHHLGRIAKLVGNSSDSHPVILIRGETGTGKDVAARLYHQLGDWHVQPFVHVDCASLPSELIEAELFGYERGAFTNAHQAKAGLIEVAEEGTLFLDEVGELPLALQAKLLNVIERRVARRIGATKEYPVLAHFVAATNRNLDRMVAEGLFRSDLYFRLNVLELELPPLRERNEDISLLAHYFIEKIARRYGLKPPELFGDALQALQLYSWPGNIRELQHVLERAVMLCRNDEILANDLVLKIDAPDKSNDIASPILNGLENMTLDEVEKYLIERTLQRTANNVSQAARALGLTRMAMRYRMDKYKL
ncbi:MAG TPA: sigma-54-dependent Fis family transcriptional regulator [Methylophaga sp.]|nr:sigma-54-dependent Fis family transcriptional regulator [Methylophaga sp.]